MIERHIRLIHGASTTLLSIVNDVLDVSKLEADRLELDCRSFCCRSLVESTLDLLKGEADAKGLGLRAEIAANVPENLVGDDTRLRQILLNLVSNALKFTARGGVVVEVAEQGGNPGTARLRVGVRDTGIGISEAARPRIFQKFSQVDGTIARSYGGTGLGLSICKRLVELMGGVIDFDSKEGEGSEFWFTVPLPVAALGSNLAVVDDDEPAGSANGRSAVILLAEDNPVNQELALSIIRPWGHRIDIVCNGAEAVDAVCQKNYDLVLMDVQMPVMDGVEATTRIRSLGGRYATMPIIAMTAAVLVNQVESFKLAGMSDHIGKPFEPRELRRMVDRWIDADGIGVGTEVEHGVPCVAAATTATLAPSIAQYAAEDPILDEAVYSQLSAMIGDEKAAHIACQFADDLARRFNDLTNRKALRIDAHTVVSSAGALGFRDLSACARQLEYACDDPGDLDGAIREFLDRRRRVGEFIARKFAPRNEAGRAVAQMGEVQHE
jgi:CheY-like chemotaxis protein/HPt (histidine-containing phosphotransfer) domain-containing protein